MLLLIAMFGMLAAGVMTLGITVYKNLTAVSAENYFQRTALSYYVNQIRTADSAGAVELGVLGGGDAILLHERIGDESYTTYLYYYDGYLCELYAEGSTQFLPGDGTRILAAGGFSASTDGVSLNISVTAADGSVYMVAVTPRCGISGEVSS